jgi:hypothetical protein
MTVRDLASPAKYSKEDGHITKSIKSVDDVMTVAAVYGSPCEHELLI